MLIETTDVSYRLLTNGIGWSYIRGSDTQEKSSFQGWYQIGSWRKQSQIRQIPKFQIESTNVTGTYLNLMILMYIWPICDFFLFQNLTVFASFPYLKLNAYYVWSVGCTIHFRILVAVILFHFVSGIDWFSWLGAQSPCNHSLAVD